MAPLLPSGSRPAIHLRPHPVRPPALFALPAVLGRIIHNGGSSSSGNDGRRLWSAESLSPSNVKSVARWLLRPLSLGLLLLLVLLYLLGGGSRNGPRQPASLAHLGPEEATRLTTALTALREGNVSLANVPVTHSDTLGKHLARLDQLFIKAYATGGSKGGKPTGLEGRSYRPPVFAPALSPEQFARFEHLLPHTNGNGGRVLFTSVLLDVEPLAPDLFGTLVGLADFLGPDRFGLSIVEGPSSDGTAHLFLEVLVPVLLEMGVSPSALYLSLDRPSADFASHNRIAVLAGLREEAVAPLRRDRPAKWSTVVFFNDVWWSLSMGLEMLSQHVKQGSDMSCAWDLLWGNDYFYDTWVARDVHTGDLYHPMGATWSPSTDLFPTSPISRARNAAHLPFQAYACWNGIAVFQASTFLGSSSAAGEISEPPIHFRRSDAAAGECAQAEVSLLCKDLWRQKAFGPEKRAAKVLVVPGVRVAYERHVAEMVRALDEASVGGLIEPDVGQPSGWAGRRESEQVAWVDKPPAKLRCHPWPEKDGLGGVNVWGRVEWIDPLNG